MFDRIRDARRAPSAGLKSSLKPLVVALIAVGATTTAVADDAVLGVTTVLGTAEEALKQAPGVSTITADDIGKRPVSNDIDELVRTMPGVNLTGNSSSGQRGNNRQIDLRGMGPENTLILIDGKPATSRNSVRYGWRGERDTRGDSNWVPAGQIERIEVIRGPAAARYGNGAAGGVVNIVTKRPGDALHGQVSLYGNVPEHSEEGATQRLGFSLSGPLSEHFAFRLSGSANNTEADDADINDGHQAPGFANLLPAGREGVYNRDFGGELIWTLVPGHELSLETSYSRQGNRYAGDTQNVNSNPTVELLLGEETNVVTRRNYALTHRGKYDFGSSLAYVQYTKTDNERIEEGLLGGTEGIFINGEPKFMGNRLESTVVHGEVNVPIQGAVGQVVTAGVEWVREVLNDPNSSTVPDRFGTIPGFDADGRSDSASARIFSVFVEDNISVTEDLLLTPGLRFDRHSEAGNNWSPALNLTYVLTDAWSLKGGIARAYKAPNLYQSNPGYLLFSSGNGCRVVSNGTNGCYLIGNEDLDAETSINKELGLEYVAGGFAASATWFRNDYRDKIEPGVSPVGITSTGNRSIYRWSNIPEAVVEGVEGSVRVPLARALVWTTNATYMIESKNKSTGDYLSIIPEYTVNTSMDWQASDRVGVLASVTFYGEQKPMKFDFQGNRVSGSSAESVDPYAIANLSARFRLTGLLTLAAGINNLFDKRLFREGNAVSVASTPVFGTSGGAGAHTYNEHGRTFFAELTAAF